MCNCTEHCFKMSDHLGVDGCYKNKHSFCVSWCHYTCFTLCLEHRPRDIEWGGREKEEQRHKEQRKSRQEKGDRVISVVLHGWLQWHSFYALTHLTRTTIECIATSLRDKIPELNLPQQTAKDFHLHNKIFWLKRGQLLLLVATCQKHKLERKIISKVLLECCTCIEVQLNIFIQ